jgi:hypothetical protein
MRNIRWFFGFGVAALLGLFLLAPPIPQPQQYHNFADQRRLIAAVPNTLNVLSNAAFLIAGVTGLFLMRRSGRFANALERWDTTVFFIGTILTSIGSTIYHLHPDDVTLVYDRGGMIVAFMAFLSMVIHERYDGARWLLPLLVVLGGASICWWQIFDDLRPYGWIQFFPIIAVVGIVALDRPRHTREVTTLSIVIASYALAKAFETFDRATYEATHKILSGHTLKHLIAAVAPLAIAIWVARRDRPSSPTAAMS